MLYEQNEGGNLLTLEDLTPPVLRDYALPILNDTVRDAYKAKVFDKLQTRIQNNEFVGISGDPLVKFTGADIDPAIYIA